jgi:hypothetical protein
MLGGREYIEQRNGKTFSNGEATWTFNWVSPTNAVSGNTIKFYIIGNYTNNNNNRSGDYPKEFVETYQFDAPPPVMAEITSFTNVLCNGGNTGSATADGTGGIAPYTFLWSNGQNTATAVNLTANTYTVTVTGASGSGSATASVTITQPAVINLSASVSGLLTCAQTSVTATATATGGTPGFDYTWSDGQTGTPVSFDAPGTYSVTATDANGCTKVASVSVNQNILEPNANAQGGTLDCVTTQISLSGAGSSVGTNFSYLWTTTDGNIVSGGNTLFPVIDDCGTYTLLVTNTSNGCTASASTTVDCMVDPPDISASNNGPLTCTTTMVTLSGNSSVSGVSYQWSGPNGFNSTLQNPTVNTPGAYTLLVTNPENSCTNVAITIVNQNIEPPTDTARVSGMLTCQVSQVEISMTTNITNGTFEWKGPNGFISNQKKDTIAIPGDYIGIVTNPTNGCKARDTITVVQNTTPPGASASVSGVLTCINTSVQILGGPNGHSYSWKGPNSYTSTEQSPTVMAAGAYSLVVTSSSNGCTSISGVTVLQNTTPPSASIAPPPNLNCNNNTVQLNASGSSQGSNFTYLWTTTDGQIISGETTLTPIVGAIGTYNLLITNTESGCTSTASTTVVQSPAVTATISSSTNVSCNGGANGAATVAAGGGNGTFTYLWSTGASTETISALIAGSYLATVTDGENCSATTSVIITQPNVLLANASATGETFLSGNDGTATAAPTGGMAGYTYQWSNGSTTAVINNLVPGSYTVTVRDANGCSDVQTVTVNAFGCSLSANITATNVTCNGANNGSASVNTSGAAMPVTYNWSNGATTESVTGLAPGAYTVSVLDANNCPAVLNTVITEPTAVSANASATNETAAGANDGTASANPTGGAGTYSFSWSNGANTSTITGLAPGAYTVSIVDANNCTAVQTVTVNSVNCTVTAQISGANILCNGDASGQATAVLIGGSLPVNYLWSNTATTATISNLLAGTYTVTATDDTGCSATSSITLTEPQTLSALASEIVPVSCVGETTGSVTLLVTGGVPPYNYNGPTGNLGVGTYSVLVTDLNGCTTVSLFEITATDNVPPVVSCPATIFLCGADIVAYPQPTATDNCGNLSTPVLMSGLPSGSAFDDGTTVQVFQATDSNGNTGTCSFAVVVYPIGDILIDNVTHDLNGAGVGSISITAIGGAGNFIYAWNKNGQLYSTNEDLTGLTAGSYSLTVTDGNGCSVALAPIIITNSVGTSNLFDGGSIKLLPNPANDFVKLEISGVEVTSGMILDTQGRLVKALKPADWNSQISIGTLNAGMYFLRLSLKGDKWVNLLFVKSK